MDDIKDSLYQFPKVGGHQLCEPIISCNKVVLSGTLLYDSLGHPHFYVVNHIASTMNKEMIDYVSYDMCNSNQMVKSCHLPLSHVHTRSKHPLILYLLISEDPLL